MTTFTVAEWAELSRIKLDLAAEFTADLVDMGFARLVAEDRYELTDPGKGVLRSLSELPVYVDEKAA